MTCATIPFAVGTIAAAIDAKHPSTRKATKSSPGALPAESAKVGGSNGAVLNAVPSATVPDQLDIMGLTHTGLVSTAIATIITTDPATSCYEPDVPSSNFSSSCLSNGWAGE